MSDSTPQENNNAFHGIGLEYDQRFREWWSVARQSEEPPSPDDFLMNFGIRPKAVQEILFNAAKENCPPDGDDQYAGPGAIHYFSTHYASCLERVSGTRRFSSELVRRSSRFLASMLEAKRDNPLDINLPSEQDLLAWAKISGKPQHWERILCLCMCCQVSKYFLFSMLNAVPKYSCLHLDFRRGFESIGSPGLRQALDNDCLEAIKKVKHRLQSVTLAGKWTKEAFLGCLQVLLQLNRLDLLRLCVPDLVEENSDTDLKLESITAEVSSSCNCGIETFELNTRNTNSEEHLLKAVPLGLQCLAFMPNLQNLCIDCLPLIICRPHVLALLRGRKLQHLDITATSTNAVPAQSAMMNILDALKDNKSLLTFQYKELPADPGLVPWAMYQEKILTVLQESNATLEHVYLGNRHSDEEFREQNEKVQYYLSLNMNGRIVARDPTTSLVDLVDLLQPAKEEILAFDLSDSEDEVDIQDPISAAAATLELKKLSLLYGLLREIPTAWICSLYGDSRSDGSGESDGASRKRKRVSS